MKLTQSVTAYPVPTCRALTIPTSQAPTIRGIGWDGSLGGVRYIAPYDVQSEQISFVLKLALLF